MRTIPCKAILLTLAVAVMVFTAAPARAIDNDTECYVCRYVDVGEMASQGYCGDPDDWGYAECDVNWFQNCITNGEMCYYIEVRPR